MHLLLTGTLININQYVQDMYVQEHYLYVYSKQSFLLYHLTSFFYGAINHGRLNLSLSLSLSLLR
jgi:hypothetical protein